MRKKFIAGLLILLCAAVALWCSLLLSSSHRIVRVDLALIGTTNSNGERFAIFRLNNSGTKTIVLAGVLHGKLCVETEKGWENRGSDGNDIGLRWFFPAESTDFLTAPPREARRWQVGVSFQEESSRMELVARTYRYSYRIAKFVPQFVWGLVPDAPAKEHEIWSKVFTNVPNTNP